MWASSFIVTVPHWSKVGRLGFIDFNLSSALRGFLSVNEVLLGIAFFFCLANMLR
jgi:hypothetical protein